MPATRNSGHFPRSGSAPRRPGAPGDESARDPLRGSLSETHDV